MAPSYSTLRSTYETKIMSGEIKPDLAQLQAILALEAFSDSLNHYNPHDRQKALKLAARFKQLFIKDRTTPHPHGLYIYGKVGRGKSTLMDLFFQHVTIAKKRRVHFHQFMLEIHARLNQLRKTTSAQDIMERLVQSIAAETSLLCFDEFHVSNIADAMILGRLFEGLFTAGVVVVSTSNAAPRELYKNGLQRDRFLPFIDLILDKMQIVEINGPTDFRYEQLRHLQSYFCPLGLETTRKLQGIFIELTHDAPSESMTLHVEGRELTVSHAAHGIGFFNFDELCRQALGAADYLAIASCLHAVILDGVPLLKVEQRNEAIRFMTLIDTLYEAKVKLFMATAAPLDRLTLADDIAVPFQRTTSRLMEMQGDAYRLKPHIQEAS